MVTLDTGGKLEVSQSSELFELVEIHLASGFEMAFGN